MAGRLVGSAIFEIPSLITEIVNAKNSFTYGKVISSIMRILFAYAI